MVILKRILFLIAFTPLLIFGAILTLPLFLCVPLHWAFTGEIPNPENSIYNGVFWPMYFGEWLGVI